MPNTKEKLIEFEVIRGEIDGQRKYCRIPVRSRIAEQIQESDIAELNAERILSMPHEQAVRAIDAIMQDWMYWLKRAGELFILVQSNAGED